MQAEAQGGSLDGKLAALGLGALEALVQPVPELAVLRAQAAVLLQEYGAAGTGRLGLGEGVLDLAGVVVAGLATTAALLRLLGHGARGAAPDGRGVAAAGEQG